MGAQSAGRDLISGSLIIFPIIYIHKSFKAVIFSRFVVLIWQIGKTQRVFCVVNAVITINMQNKKSPQKRAPDCQKSYETHSRKFLPGFFKAGRLQGVRSFHAI